MVLHGGLPFGRVMVMYDRVKFRNVKARHGQLVYGIVVLRYGIAFFSLVYLREVMYRNGNARFGIEKCGSVT